MPRVALIDPLDREFGMADRDHAHLEGNVHRAFSIFVFRPDGRMLLQRQARTSPDSGGLWSNACCSHPAPGESLEHAARRRLREETGIDCELRRAFGFLYRAEVSRGLFEHEFDHVFVGRSDTEPFADPHDASAWRDVHLDELAREIAKDPGRFTVRFLIALSRFVSSDLTPDATPPQSNGPTRIQELPCSTR